MQIFAAAGALVRDPFTRQPLPADGLTVDDNDIYWARALADGDVVTEQPKLTKAAERAIERVALTPVTKLDA